jgi:hypothetical protein
MILACACDQFSVRLTMQQVKNSPGVDTDRPVSRQMEANTYDYYGWNPYWSNGLRWAAIPGKAVACRRYLTAIPCAGRKK